MSVRPIHPEAHTHTHTHTARSAALDVYKGILIILVVLGHSVSNFGGGGVYSSSSYLLDPLYQLLYTFHMPLFMGISGWLFASTVRKYSTGQVIEKRIWQIVPSYLFWCLINLLCFVYWGGDSLSFSRVLRGFINPYWFVTTLLLFSVFVALLHHWVGRQWQMWGFVLVLPLGFVVSHIPLVGYGLEEFWFNYPFFIGAYLLAYYPEVSGKLLALSKSAKAIIAISALALFALLFVGYKGDMIIFVSKYSLRGSSLGWGMQLYYDVYRFSIALVGCVLFLVAFDLLPTNGYRSAYWKPMVWLGRNTLGIYMIQEILFAHIVRHIPFPPADSSYLWHWLCTAIVIAVCAAIIWVLRLTPLGKYIV